MTPLSRAGEGPGEGPPCPDKPIPNPKPYHASQPIKQRAIQLRQQQTPAEALLWSRPRNAQLAGFKFRRQHPIDRYITDFYCPACRLIVELDGPIHDFRADYDTERAAILCQQNRTALRFPNDQILTNLDETLQQILTECHRLSNSQNKEP